jgi:hypothetical protein
MPNSPPKDAAPGKPHRLRLPATLALGLIVLYLVGIGPAARLDAKRAIPPQIYETLYWPLVSFAQSTFGQSVGLGRLLDWYVMDVWKPYPDPPPPPTSG